ncbi:MAG: sulfotransferase [Acidobacteriota bacterium]
MRLDHPFIRLPVTFDAAELAREVGAFDESSWRAHPQGYPGNTALPLIAANGNPDDDDVQGVMRPTPNLQRMPYLRQVLAAFQAVWGRTRLMRLDGNAEATLHADTNYYWAHHARVHVPIVTDPDVRFLCGESSVHMAAGEAWLFDTWRQHNVINPNPTRRIHLVADTVGSAAFWELVSQGLAPAAPKHGGYDPLRAVTLAMEAFNHPLVMHPSEQDELAYVLYTSIQDRGEDVVALRLVVDTLRHDWRAAWARFGDGPAGWPLFRDLKRRAETSLLPLHGRIRLANQVDAVEAALSLLLRPALGRETEANGPRAVAATALRRSGGRIEQPVFIVCAPRSGSSLFFETLGQSPSLWTVGGESHGIIEGLPALHPATRLYHSNRLDASDATPAVIVQLQRRFAARLRNRDAEAPRPGTTAMRLLEKTPKNALRVPFLAAAFPDARFIYLYRDMRDTISSMLDAWRSGKFVTYPQLPGWDGPPWSLLLTPGWRELSGHPLAEIVAWQWASATRYLLDDLEQLRPSRWCIAGYDSLLADPQREMKRLSSFLEIAWDRELAGPLPHSKTTLTPPDPEKWRRNADDLAVALPLVEDVASRARGLFAETPGAH